MFEFFSSFLNFFIWHFVCPTFLASFAFVRSLHASHKACWYDIHLTQSGIFEILNTDNRQKEISKPYEKIEQKENPKIYCLAMQ